MKKFIVFIIACALLVMAGCGNKNILFKDDIYTITKGNETVNVLVNNNAILPSVHVAAKEYIDDTALPCLYVLKYENDVLTVTSYDYDGDAKADFKQWKLNCATDVTFNSITIVDEKGNINFDNVSIPQEEYKYIGEYYTCGYFKFNNTGEVTNITFYGDTVIQ